ncbi:stage II sporulation protein M [Candidatus Leptofilum sp.]|uniref:stage II sporulation protein M n=1 Tax=Candidatus Leptofilum sp. TaxID=3241576 RepID=UPI003B5B79CD
MIAISRPTYPSKHDLRMATVVARREIRDSFRDWRIIIPIFLLTLIFPALMNFTASRLLNFVADFGAEVIANQLIPFLLLVVGFFPMSFSLIIALETFVGEKERKSMEPLLSTPLSNAQLYAGKMVAALVPPLSASYLGMAVYMIGLTITVDWQPEFQLVLQTILLTTVQGMIMVAGAVVVSSQATSVRAANLLASFIIVPMAILIQAEAAALFWGNHDGLWWLLLALTITAVVLMRMGLSLFNREELLGRDIDQIRLGWMVRQFWGYFSGKTQLGNGRYPNPLVWFKQTWAIVPSLLKPMGALLLALGGAAIIGIFMAQQFPFPDDLKSQLNGQNMLTNLAGLEVYLSALPLFIVSQNVRALLLQTILGIFTLGVLGVLIFMLPWGIISFIAMQFYMAGENPLQFLLGTIVPHAIFELPVLLLISASALRWQTVTFAPLRNRSLSEMFIIRGAEFWRILLGLGIPLLLLAALVEAYVTPQVLRLVYGG